MSSRPSGERADAVPDASPSSSLPSVSRLSPAARHNSLSRAARKRELVKSARLGNVSAFRHGVRAIVANQPDVDCEIALCFAARPGLDPIRDRRLVETYSMILVQHARCALAIQEQGMTQTLTSYDRTLAALVERLERAVHERERQRNADLRSHRGIIDLTRYAPEPPK